MKPKTFSSGVLEEPVYVGIDQSYSGFAICILSEDSYFVTVHKGEGKGTDRLLDIKKTLKDILCEYQILDIAMEGYAYGAQMAHMAGELGGMVKTTLLEEFEIYPLIIPPANLKKYVTGKGTGIQKNQMLLQIYKTWGIEFTDDNAADAYALARMASGWHKTASQKEVLEKLQDPKFRNV